MILLAIDPGNSTGWSLFATDEPNKPILLAVDVDKYTPLGLYQVMAEREPDIIVYERFALYATKAESMINNDMYPAQLIGVIKMYAEYFNVKLIEQTAQQGKAIWKDDKLKKFDFYDNSEHTRDSIRHGLTYLKVHKIKQIADRWLE